MPRATFDRIVAAIAHALSSGNPHSTTAAEVGADPTGTAAAAVASHAADASAHSQYTTPIEAAAAAPVQSVNGQTGAVVLTASSVGAAESAHAHATATPGTAGFLSAADKAKLDGLQTSLDGYQPLDADLTAIAALAATGYAKRLGAGSWTVTAGLPWGDLTGVPTTLAGFGITDAATAAHTHAGTYQPLAADLTAIAALASTGYAKRTGAGTWSLSGSIPYGDLSGVPATFAPSAHTHPWADLSGKPTTLSGYGITDAQPLDADLTAIAALASTGYAKRTGAGTWSLSGSIPYGDLSGVPATFAPSAHTHPWADLSGKPTTLSGYGITDGQPLDADLTAIAALTSTGYAKRTGAGTWAVTTTVPWADLSTTPTTLSGYGITDAQPLDADLTAIAALAATGYAKRTGAGTWAVSATVPYGDLSGVPATFAPSAHTHPWADLTGVPSTFAPSAHTHALSDLTQSGATAGQVPTWSGTAWVPGTPASAATWGSITGTLSNQTDLSNALAGKQPLEYPLSSSLGATDGGKSVLAVYSDTFDANTIACMHMDASPLVEALGRTVTTASGGYSPTQQKFGAGSCALTGGAGSPSVTVTNGYQFTGDFTVEYQGYCTATVAEMIGVNFGATDGAGRFMVYVKNGVLTLNRYSVGDTSIGGSVSLNGWHHIAFVRVGSTLTAYLDGNSVGSTGVLTGAQGRTDGFCLIGNSSYMDELRISNTARYTGNFTPPAAAFGTLTKSFALSATAPALLGANNTFTGANAFAGITGTSGVFGTDPVGTELLRVGSGLRLTGVQTFWSTSNIVHSLDFYTSSTLRGKIEMDNTSGRLVYGGVTAFAWKATGPEVTLRLDLARTSPPTAFPTLAQSRMHVGSLANATTDGYDGITAGYGTSTTYAPGFIGWQCKSTGGNTYGDWVIATRGATTDTAPTERLRVTWDGKVISSGDIQLFKSAATDAQFLLQVNGTGSMQCGMNASGSTNAAGAPNGSIYLGSNGAFNLHFTSGGSSRMSIDTSGNVNINTGSEYRINGVAHAHTFASLTSKPTTLSGYGITDAVGSASPTFTGTVTFDGASASLKSSGTIYGYVSAYAGGSQLQDSGMAARMRWTTTGVAFNGTTPIAQPTLNAASTDLTTAVALLNQVRSALINYGLCA